MPVPQSIPAGAPCWADLTTSDTEGSREFYSQLFGWTAEEPAEQFGGYFSFTREGVLVAGCMARQPGSPISDVWSVYLATDDAGKTLAAATAHGGQIVVPAMQVGDLGTMGFITDVGGAGIGLWQPGQHRGFGVMAETGAPSWFELYTRDYDAAVSFYQEVFHWETDVASDTPEFRYTTLRHGEQQFAGIMDAGGFLPAGAPAHWVVYFGVADADAAVARIAELRGSVLQAPEDTPYGRLATAADPAGAQFKIIAPNEAVPAS